MQILASLMEFRMESLAIVLPVLLWVVRKELQSNLLKRPPKMKRFSSGLREVVVDEIDPHIVFPRRVSIHLFFADNVLYEMWNFFVHTCSFSCH